MIIEQGEKNPILRKKAEEVAEINEETDRFIAAMRRLLKKAKGVGLAAPQAGKSSRVFILSLPEELRDKSYPEIFINPVLLERSAEEEIMEEGCLSLPGIYGEVPRAKRIKIRAVNKNGDEFEVEANGIPARVIQHEYDHLEGILFIDRALKIGEATGKRGNKL